ncbi:T9SS type B sorting domain-containing protein [Brumimicrobium glaciale]|uniref:T9SS type B sorting domain-containing protein n=1 Tax=Brumimicrobium glaciale TaxID=200475 RepID=A0A4Q4KJP8_9FLAO|nr:gliding motility-associated C-terminal domain-containing protein [Brumimicrobium glaciale]RYM33501.1 T9SS type B sorting domain-containing protein [Brumimicrobium glaciale]
MYRFSLLLYIFLLVFTGNTQEITHAHSVHHAFIENKGQWGDHVFFKNKVEGGNMWVEQGRILFQLQDYSKLQEAHFSKKEIKEDITFKEKLIELEFVDALEIRKVEKKGATAHYYNYFLGNDESKWASDVRGFEEFTLKEIYAGIDIRFIEQEKQIKYEFIVAPGIETNQIKLKYSYQDELKIDKGGNLIIKTELGNIIEEKPYAYQIVNGNIVEISCEYELIDNVVTFKLGEYNKRVALVIDPTLVFATYNGALSDNFGMTATYGHDGSAFTGGTIYGNSHPMPDPNAYDISSNMTVTNVGGVTTDAFVVKYSADGTTMLWATFYGGGTNTNGTDVPHSLICDAADNLYAFGSTSSLDFPIVNGFQSNHGGGVPFAITSNGTNFGIDGTDIYVVKFSTDGHNLLGSTYVGGNKNDGINYMISAGNYTSAGAYDSLTTNYGDQFRGEIMLDSLNNIIIGSCSRSANFPTQNAFQPALAGQQDGVIFKLKNDFSTLLFSSYYGGSQADAIYSVKIDSSYNIVFGGGTTSLDLNSTPGAYQSTNAGGEADGFIGKLSPDGLTLTHSTYVGTLNYDQVFFVEIDRLDNIFVLGQSNGGLFPVINAAYSNPNSSQFIARFDPDLSIIEGSTVFGSGNPIFDISPSAFLVDICGNMYVSGWGANILQASPMSGMPVTQNAFQSTPPSGFDFYLMVVEQDFNGLLYGSYLGSTSSPEHVDGGTSRFDKNGVVYQGVCGGCGGFSNFPTTPGAWSNQNLSTNCNALTFKFDFNLIPNAEFSIASETGCAPFEVNFENFSSDSDSYLWDFGNGDVDSTTFEPTVIYSTPGVYNVILTVLDSICSIVDTAYITIEVFPQVILESIPEINVCDSTSITMTADANGTATSFVWSTNNNFTDTLNLSIADSTVTIVNPADGYYYFMASNGGCSVMDSVEVINLVLDADITPDNSIGCSPFIVNFENTSSGAYSFVWDFGSGNLDSTTVDPTITYTDPGFYEVILIITDSICFISDTAFITIEVYPEIDLENIPEINLCVPDTITLTADANGTATSFVWSTNINFTDTLNLTVSDSSVTINDPVYGYYYVTVSNNGCSVIDSVSVNFTSANLVIEGNTNLCLGDETVISALSNNSAVTFVDFDWQPDSIVVSGDGTSDVTIQPNVSQYVYVTAVANNGCVLFDSILVLVSDIDVSSVLASASESIIPAGTDVTLSAKPDGYSYSWSPSENVANPTAQETNATLFETTTFTVSISDGICTKTSSVTVKAFPYLCNEPFIFVPNAFTPNGDGENDVLYIRSQIVSDVIFRIYNRWGELIYESTTLHEGWDGTFKGKKLDPDVYDYYLEGHCIDDQEFLIKGNITLIR